MVLIFLLSQKKHPHYLSIIYNFPFVFLYLIYFSLLPILFFLLISSTFKILIFLFLSTYHLTFLSIHAQIFHVDPFHLIYFSKLKTQLNFYHHKDCPNQYNLSFINISISSYLMKHMFLIIDFLITSYYFFNISLFINVSLNFLIQMMMKMMMKVKKRKMKMIVIQQMMLKMIHQLIFFLKILSFIKLIYLYILYRVNLNIFYPFIINYFIGSDNKYRIYIST